MNYYPPPWGYGPPPKKQKGLTQKDIDRAVNRALGHRDHDKNSKRKRKEEQAKKAAVSRQRFLISLEWFIVGILLQPIINPLYDHLIAYLTK